MILLFTTPTFVGAPSAPSDPDLEFSGGGTMPWVADLVWTLSASPLVDGQRVERKDGAADWAAVMALAATVSNATDLGPLVEGVTYGYRVVALNAAGDSPPSNEVFGVPLGVPAAPSDLRVTFRSSP